MVEHVTVNHMMRVRFPRGTELLLYVELSNIMVLYLFAKQKVWVQFPSQLINIILNHRGGMVDTSYLGYGF